VAGEGIIGEVSGGFVISWVEADRRWAEWIAYHVNELGLPVHIEYPAGSNRTVEYQRMLESGYRVIAVVSPESIGDPVTTGEWASALTLDPSSAGRRVIPMLVKPCDAGLLRPLVPLRLYELDAADMPADRLLAALGLMELPRRVPEFPGLTKGEDRSLRLVDALIKQAPQDERRFLVPSGDPLPQLRLLSERARAEAGSVGVGSRLTDDFGAGLYVVRDIEAVLVDRLRDRVRTPQILVGDPGAGKTSLLWGIATRLLANDDHEVLLVKATWLRATAEQPALVTSEMIAAAIAEAGRDCMLMIDTADLVVNTEEGHLALVGAVDTAINGGASVVVTSRPDEVQLLPAGWDRVPLTNYGTESSDGTPSEFERAIASHSRFYCSSAESSREMAARLISAVARRQPLGQLCLRPLTLRLLFQLYAPSTVADNVDVTGLYYAFWRDRVCRDRRVWAPEVSPPDPGRDLSQMARSLALAMLREGNPEITLRTRFDPAEDDRLRRDVGLLVQRGVGEILDGGNSIAFRFFHQTFFEFAAAQALLHTKGLAALSLLEQRLRQRPDDYLLLAVFEQTWLCAWRDETMSRMASDTAERMLDELLLQLGPGEGRETLPYPLQRTLLAVLAQGSDIPTSCCKKLGDALAAVSLPVVRDCLALMPPPLRNWTENDLDVVLRCADRTDAAWVSVLDVLTRLVQRDGRLAASAVRRLKLADLIARVPAKDFFGIIELPELLADLLPVDPTYALGKLTELGRFAMRENSHNYLATILRLVLRRADDLPEVDLAGWTDDIVGVTTDRKQAVIVLHAEAHRISAVRRATRNGWPSLLEELGDALAAVAEGKKVTAPDGARLGGVLTALAIWGPLSTVPTVDSLLGARDEPHVHAEIHRGWLVGYTCRAPNLMMDLWVDRLVEGLPASHRQPNGAPQRWADTIRRTLERPDVDPAVAAGVAERVAKRLGGDEVTHWLDPDVLLRLVVRGAGIGLTAAREAAVRIRAGYDLDPDALRTFLQQAARLDFSAAEEEVVLDTLIERGECGYLDQFLDKRPDHPLREHATRLWALVTKGMASHRITARRDAGRLLQTLVRRGGLKPPPWRTLTGWFTEANDVAVRISLIQVMGAGLGSGHYSADAMWETLRPLREELFGGVSSADVLEARSQLVVAIAKWGSPSDADELLDLAFQEPIEASVLAKVSSFVQAEHRVGAVRPDMPEVTFLMEFGQRLKCTPARARKDTAVRWRPAMAEMLARAGAEDQISVLNALVTMDELFAASIVLQLEPWRHPAVRKRLNELLDDRRVGARLRRNLRMVLATKTGHLARYDWPELPELLKPHR
jgi:hypothetical protein